MFTTDCGLIDDIYYRYRYLVLKGYQRVKSFINKEITQVSRDAAGYIVQYIMHELHGWFFQI